MAAETVNEVVHNLIDLANTYPIRLAEPDREDATCITYRVADGDRDALLGGGVSGLEVWRYMVTVRGNDGAGVETESRAIQDAIDAVAINTVDGDFVIQSVFTGSISDEDREEIVSDQFEYQYSFIINLAVGKAA